MGYKISFAEQMGRTEAMLAGLNAHGEQLRRRGIDQEFIGRLDDTFRRACTARTAQLAFKARMMEQTEEYRRSLDELLDLYSEARNQVKLELPLETWREFGICDQR